MARASGVNLFKTRGTWTYTWYYENRQKQASKSGGVTVTHGYDPLGRGLQRSSTTNGSTKFVYDGADVVRDLDGTDATIADYLNAPGIDNKFPQTISSAGFLLTHRSAISPFCGVRTFSGDR